MPSQGCDRRHQDRAKTRPASLFDCLAQGNTVAPTQDVGVVDEQNSVVDDQPTQHDDPHVKLWIRHLDLDLGGSRRRVEYRCDSRHISDKRLARKGVDPDTCPHALLDARKVALDDIGDQPHETAVVWLTYAPGSRYRRPTNPSTGENITVLARLIRSSSRKAPAWSNWAWARSIWALAA